MSRNLNNPNLTLHHESTYLGLPIQAEKGPFVLEYLDRLHRAMYSALEQYDRVFAFRIDLRLPADQNLLAFSYKNEIIDRFFASFKAKLRHNREMARQAGKYAQDTVIRYAWTREFGQRGRPHYHLVILLNYKAFHTLGEYVPGRDNMFNRLQSAFASALGLPPDAVRGLVEFPENPSYWLSLDDKEGIAKFFFRASYLCKSATKVFGDGSHGFGASRI